MSTPNTAPKVLAHLRMSNEIAKRHQDILEKAAADSKTVKAAASEAVDALVANERIFEHQKENVLEKISADHKACLELIRDLSNHRNAAEIESIGKTVGQEKKASAYRAAGQAVADFDELESGDAFRRRLLGQS